MRTETSRTPAVVFGLCLLAALVAVIVLALEGPPGSGYGWGSVVVSMVLVTSPLVFVALGVLSGDPRYAVATVVVAALTGIVVVLALIGNWSGGSTRDHVLDAVLAIAVLGACVPAVRVQSRLVHTPPRARPHGR